MSESDRDHWFPAKTVGYGWGPPRRWQGWVVLALYMAAVIGIALRFPPITETRRPAAARLIAESST